jgi:hypothetical protein
MRRSLALAALTVPLFGAELKIDHVTVAGTQLQELREAFTAVTGIPTEYGGPHSNKATEMALASFPDGSYIELMGLQKGADASAVAAHAWSPFLRKDAGPCAFALRVPDVSAEVARLRSAGVIAGSTEKSGRTRPDGVVLSWETAGVGAGPRGEFFPFLIRDFTPRDQRVFPEGRPTAKLFGGVGLVVIGVRDLNASIAQYRKAFALAAPKRQRDDAFGADLAWFEGTPVVLAASLSTGSWLGQRIAELGEAPCAFVLSASKGVTMTAEKAQRWAGHTVIWFSDAKLGWRLGVQTAP